MPIFPTNQYQANNYYHIYNRGVAKMEIFKDEQDFKNFLYRLKILIGKIPPPKRTFGKSTIRLTPFEKDSYKIHAFCLMDNHFHFFIEQTTSNTVSALIHKLCTSYSMYFNKKYSRVGPLFQSGFRSKHINSDQYFKYVSAYIHNNPKNPLTYPYSSFQAYLDIKPDGITETNTISKWFDNDLKRYKKFVLNFSKSQKEKAVLSGLNLP